MKTINNFKGEFEFLSNFFREKRGSTLENKFQACKTDNWDWKFKILEASTPAKAKHLGRKAPLRKDWEQVKVATMYALLREKFVEPELKNKLLETDGALLVEGNDWHDNFWGDCHCQEKPGRFGQKEVCKYTGKNVLGLLLMKLRDEFKSEIS